ncbi:hypothetical protein [Apilactobacillus xinyiensis]|uniref:hypothetical protein n=1 Tax=Apilactobacillus xinyiensis TaxID=2841032 RepID=UPI00200D6B92|nr:hypothetical protein [Apilactobacillus xinyiensis]MCL0330568.1 hypothetical protein [Apilactobacillus xinyiensis]
MKITIEANSKEVSQLLKNLSATENSKEISNLTNEYAMKQLQKLFQSTEKNLFRKY